MRTVYACTHVEKTTCEDHYERGCDTISSCVLYESVNHTSDTFAGLLQELRKHYGLELDDLFLPSDEDELHYFGFNRLEMGDGQEPREYYLNRWKKGEYKLYLADYLFSIEKLVVCAVPIAEIQAAQVKVH